MKAKIDRSGCIGCGLCEGICPEVFRMAEDSLAEVYSDVTTDLEESTAEARDTCPVGVISTEE